LFERPELIDARVVHENVEASKGLLRLREQAGDVRRPGNVGLNGDSPATGAGDVGDDLVRAGFAGGVIDDTAAPSAARCRAMAAPMPLDAR